MWAIARKHYLKSIQEQAPDYNLIPYIIGIAGALITSM